MLDKANNNNNDETMKREKKSYTRKLTSTGEEGVLFRFFYASSWKGVDSRHTQIAAP